jgi:hypothetical protein
MKDTAVINYSCALDHSVTRRRNVWWQRRDSKLSHAPLFSLQAAALQVWSAGLFDRANMLLKVSVFEQRIGNLGRYTQDMVRELARSNLSTRTTHRNWSRQLGYVSLVLLQYEMKDYVPDERMAHETNFVCGIAMLLRVLVPLVFCCFPRR